MSEKIFLHEERCAGVKCILKENCFKHKIPVNLARNTIRNFLIKKGDNYTCDKYEALKDLNKLN